MRNSNRLLSILFGAFLLTIGAQGIKKGINDQHYQRPARPMHEIEHFIDKHPKDKQKLFFESLYAKKPIISFQQYEPGSMESTEANDKSPCDNPMDDNTEDKQWFIPTRVRRETVNFQENDITDVNPPKKDITPVLASINLSPYEQKSIREYTISRKRSLPQIAYCIQITRLDPFYNDTTIYKKL